MDPLHSQGRDMKSDQVKAAHDDSWSACLSGKALSGSGLLNPDKMLSWPPLARRLPARTEVSAYFLYEHFLDGPHLLCLNPPTWQKRKSRF